jgi:hypothetical protein
MTPRKFPSTLRNFQAAFVQAIDSAAHLEAVDFEGFPAPKLNRDLFKASLSVAETAAAHDKAFGVSWLMEAASRFDLDLRLHALLFRRQRPELHSTSFSTLKSPLDVEGPGRQEMLQVLVRSVLVRWPGLTSADRTVYPLARRSNTTG